MAQASEIILIARQYDIVETVFSPGISLVSVTKADYQRVALGFSQPGSGTVVISTRSGVVSGDGMPLLNAGGILWFTLSDHGTFCQQQWYAVGTAPAAKLTVLEVFFRDR